MGIQINGNTNNINAGIGSLSIEDINELDIVGVATAANFKTGVSNLHNVGLTLSGGQIDVGSNIKIGTAGVITATSFIGSGANLTGIDTDLVSDTSPQLGGDLQSNGSDILIADNDYLKIGTGNDLTFRHDAAGGNHSYIMHSGAGDFKIGSDTTFYLGKTGPETFIKAIPDGAVELYHNNVKKFETNSSGAKVYGSLLVDSVLDISPPGSNAVLIKNPANGIIGFGANNQTNQVIITTAGHLGITGDNQELRLGASEDLKLYHDGSHSRIVDSGTGHLKIQGSKVQLLNADGSEEYLSAQNGGGVKLRHNNVVKLECTSTGLNVTGGVRLGGNNAANELDDYEEGSWNPLWSNSASNSGGTTTSNNMYGKYTKIGRIVHAYFYTWGLPTGNTGSMYLQGFPFQCNGNPGAFFCSVQSAFYNFGDDHYYNLGLRLSTNRTFAELIFCRDNSGNYIAANFNGFINYYTNFVGMMTYEVA